MRDHPNGNKQFLRNRNRGFKMSYKQLLQENNEPDRPYTIDINNNYEVLAEYLGMHSGACNQIALYRIKTDKHVNGFILAIMNG